MRSYGLILIAMSMYFFMVQFKNTSLQKYKIQLNVTKQLIRNDVHKFYDEQLKKSLQPSWQSNSKLNALLLLLDNTTTASLIMGINSNIPNELIEAVTERSSACLVRVFRLNSSNIFQREKRHNVNSGKIGCWSILSIDKGHTLRGNTQFNWKWTTTWWRPLVKALESNDKVRKTYAYEV